MQMFVYNALKMSVKFVSKKSEFDPWVRGSVFFQINLKFKKVWIIQPNSDFVLNFLRFLIMTPLLRSKENVVTDH